MSSGSHRISFFCDQCNYVGIGIIDSKMTEYDVEFHNKKGCSVYYWGGRAYIDGIQVSPSTEIWGTGDILTLEVNFNSKSVELRKQDTIIRKDVLPSGTSFLPAALLNGKSSLTIMYD